MLLNTSCCSYPDYEAVVKLSEDFNGADLRNVCTEAGKKRLLPFFCDINMRAIMVPLIKGMCAIRSERDYVTNEDFMKAVRKVGDNKKLETKLDYKKL